ncbi:hypothetical protein GQ457_09G010640 [Hibiscus cannabinus]
MSNNFFWVEFREELRSMIENYWKSRTLIVTISHLLCPITLEALYQVFSAYGLVEKIIPVQESSGFQVLVQYQERQNAISATFSLQGRNIYDGCCQMDIQFGNDSQLTDDVEPKQEQKVLVSTVEVLTAVELGGNLLESTEWAKAEHKPLLTVSNEVKMFDELSMPTEEESDGFDDSIVVSLEDDLIKSSELDEVMENGSVFEGCERVRNMRICRQFSKMDGSHQNGQFKQLVSIMKRMGEHSDVESRDVDQLAIDMGNNKTSSLPQEQEVAGIVMIHGVKFQLLDDVFVEVNPYKFRILLMEMSIVNCDKNVGGTDATSIMENAGLRVSISKNNGLVKIIVAVKLDEFSLSNCYFIVNEQLESESLQLMLFDSTLKCVKDIRSSLPTHAFILFKIFDPGISFDYAMISSGCRLRVVFYGNGSTDNRQTQQFPLPAHLQQNCNINLRRDIIRNRFHGLQGVKYKDPKSGLVTMTSTDDLRLAESVGGVSRGLLSLYTVEVSSNQEPTYKEVNKENVVKSDKKLNNVVENGEAIKGTCMEDWIGQFAVFFNIHVELGFDLYLDLHDFGMKLYSEVMEDVLTSEATQERFEITTYKFQEMIVLTLFKWGNVRMSKARNHVRLIEDSIESAYGWEQKEFVLAAKRYEAALKIKSDFHEGLEEVNSIGAYIVEFISNFGKHTTPLLVAVVAYVRKKVLGWGRDDESSYSKRVEEASGRPLNEGYRIGNFSKEQLFHRVLEHSVWLEDANKARELYFFYYQSIPKNLECLRTHKLILAMRNGDELFVELIPKSLRNLVLKSVKGAVMIQFASGNMKIEQSYEIFVADLKTSVCNPWTPKDILVLEVLFFKAGKCYSSDENTNKNMVVLIHENRSYVGKLGGNFIVIATMTKVVHQCMGGKFQRIEYLRTSRQHKKVAAARHNFISSISGNKLKVFLWAPELSLVKTKRAFSNVWSNHLKKSSDDPMLLKNYHLKGFGYCFYFDPWGQGSFGSKEHCKEPK